MTNEDWAEPKITANAMILAGMIIGSTPDGYRAEALQHPAVLKNLETGNRYRVTVEQISGTE